MLSDKIRLLHKEVGINLTFSVSAHRSKLTMKARMVVILFSTVIYRTPSKIFFAILANSELKVILGFETLFDMS
jgi:hypothetical protein